MARGTRKREEDGEQLGCLMRRGKTARRLSFNRLQRVCTLRKKTTETKKPTLRGNKQTREKTRRRTDAEGCR